jgi:hypothetical protein
MNYSDLVSRLGHINDLEFAQSTCSRSDVINKIFENIKSKGLDVDEDYLNFVKNLNKDEVQVEIKYLPIYVVEAIAKLSWKEVDPKANKSEDHQEFVRFTSTFYAGQEKKKCRYNNIDPLSCIGKENIKMNETTYSDDSKIEQIETNDDTLKIEMKDYHSPVILDCQVVDGETYSLDTNSVLGQSDIDKRVQETLEQTKSYKKLSKEKEKWSRIEQTTIKVILLPVAYIHIGQHDQLVNCANEIIDVEYELNPKITKDLLKSRAVLFPGFAIGLILCIAGLVVCMFKEVGNVYFFNEYNINYAFKNFNGYILIITVILLAILTVIALPTRKALVKRLEKDKNTINFIRSISLFIYGLDLGLVIYFLSIIQSIK